MLNTLWFFFICMSLCFLLNLSFFLAFFASFFLAFVLSFLLAFFRSFFLAFVLSCLLSFLLAFFTCLLSFFLACLLSFLLSRFRRHVSQPVLCTRDHSLVQLLLESGSAEASSITCSQILEHSVTFYRLQKGTKEAKVREREKKESDLSTCLSLWAKR